MKIVLAQQYKKVKIKAFIFTTDFFRYEIECRKFTRWWQFARHILITILTMSILFLSCGGTSSQTSKPKHVDENWQIANWSITKQTWFVVRY
jgi:hypothetical protein